ILIYLALAAEVTQASYQIAQLEDQQRQLLAEQDQLRYQEVTLHAPAQVEQQAAQTGMQRVPPTNYVSSAPVAIDLQAPVGSPPPHRPSTTSWSSCRRYGARSTTATCASWWSTRPSTRRSCRPTRCPTTSVRGSPWRWGRCWGRTRTR